MGSLLQDVIGLFSKKKFVKPLPYTLSKDDYFVLSTKGDSSLNVMAYLPKVEQELISTQDLANAISSGTDTTYDYTSAQNGLNVDLVLTGSDTTIDIVKLIAGTNITLTDDGANQVTVASTDQFLGTVTSVSAIHDGSAFTVSVTDPTTTPIIDIQLVGTALQYITGEGNLATFPSVGSMTSFLIKGDSGTTHTITDGLTVTIEGGTKISTVGSVVDTIEVIHDATTRTDTTSTASPAAGATFTTIDAITSDTTGHITGVNTKTITLPAGGGGGGGTVTNVDATFGGSAITVTGGPVTTTGTFAFDYTGTTSQFIDGTGELQTIISPVLNVGEGLGINMTGTATSPVVNIDYSGVNNAILTAPTNAVTTDDYIWFSDSADNNIKKCLVSDLPGGGGSAVTQIVAGNNITISPAGGTGIVTINSTDQFVGTVTSVATANSTFIDVTGGIITAAGTITAGLSATGVPDATNFLRGDNTWSVADNFEGFTIQDIQTPPNVKFIFSNSFMRISGGPGITMTIAGAGTPGNNFGLNTILDPYIGATSGAAGIIGGVPPAPSADRLKFLRGDATWQPLSGITGWVADSDEGTDISVAAGSTLMFAGAVTSGGAGIATDSAISAGDMTIGLINNGGTPSATTFYRGDGQWITPSGSGTVTTVSSTTTGDALDVAVSNASTTPALAFTWAGAVGQYIDGEGNLQTFPPIPQGDITEILAGDGITVNNGGGPVATVLVDYLGTDNIIGVRATVAANTNDFVMFYDSTDDNVYKTQISNLPGFYSPWLLDADSGSTQVINGGNTAKFLGGLGLTSAVSATDTVTFNLDQMSSTVRGGAELFSDTVQSVAANSVSTTALRTYGLQLNGDGQLVVNVPWTDGGSYTWTTQADSGTNFGIQNAAVVDFSGGPGITTINLQSSGIRFGIDYLGSDNYISIRTTGVPVGDDTIAFVDIDDSNVYKCTISDAIAAGGGYVDWRFQGDSGTNELVLTGQTVNFDGGTALTTVSSSPDILTINHDAFGTAGTYAHPSSITTNATGHITSITAGSVPYDGWNLTGDAGSVVQVIANGNTASFLGGTGISTIAQNTDNLTIVNTKPFDSLVLAASTGSNSTILNNGTMTIAAGLNISTTNNGSGQVTIAYTGPTGGMTDFTLAGDSGSNSNIGDGDTVTIIGGTNITTVGNGSDGVTINYTGNTGTMSSWLLNGDSGPQQTVNNGEDVAILGGLAISTVASAADTISVNHNTFGTSGTYNNPTQIVTNSSGHVTSVSVAGSPPMTGFTLTASAGASSSIVDGDIMTLIAGANISTTGNGTDGVTIAYTGGTGTMNNWFLDGDTGPIQTISNGETAIFGGGTGISTVVSASDTITIGLDDTSVTPGTYTYATLTVDQQGRLTLASSGVAPGTMSDWKIGSTTGADQTVSNGQTVDVVGGTAISGSIGGTRTVTLSHDAFGTAGTYTYPVEIETNTEGHVVSVTNGTAPMASWNLASNTGTTATINNGQQASILGGTLISGNIVGNVITLNYTGNNVAPIPVKNAGAQITPGVTSFDFTGGGVTATATGNAVTVDIPLIAASYQAGCGLEIDVSTAPDTISVDYVGTDNVVYCAPLAAGTEPTISEDFIIFHDDKDSNAYKCTMQAMFDNWVASNPQLNTSILAWWSMDNTGIGPGFVNTGHTAGLGTVTLTFALGTYNVAFTTAQSSTNYLVNVNTEEEGPNAYTDRDIITYISNKTTTGFTVNIRDSNNGRINQLVNIQMMRAI